MQIYKKNDHKLRYKCTATINDINLCAISYGESKTLAKEAVGKAILTQYRRRVNFITFKEESETSK